MKPLVTGASGFVGRALCDQLHSRGLEFVATSRRPLRVPWNENIRTVPDLGGDVDWRDLLGGVDTVFHLAAHVHVEPGSGADDPERFRRVNVDATVSLASSALAAGVGRFVFLSSIAAENREGSHYGESKRAAEERLAEIGDLDRTVIRPPMVYGPGAPGRFCRLFRAVARGLPLPLGRVKSRRSMIYVKNLVDAMLLCAASREARNRTYAVADDEVVAVADLVKDIASALGIRSRLIPVPTSMLRVGLVAMGRGHIVDALLEDCVVDDGAIRYDLGWSSPVSREEALRETARWYRENAARTKG